MDCNPAPLLLERLSVCSPMLTYWAVVCVDLVDMPTAWMEKACFYYSYLTLSHYYIIKKSVIKQRETRGSIQTI